MEGIAFMEAIRSPVTSIEHALPEATSMISQTCDDHLPPSPQRSRSPVQKMTLADAADGSSHRPVSPAASSLSSRLSSISATAPPQMDGTNDQPPAKRRKLTPGEKAVQDQEKAEAKAKREADKLVKDEERRLKNEALEERKREKEMKKQKEEDEKAKKEKAQPRINGFFKKPQPLVEENIVPVEMLPDVNGSAVTDTKMECETVAAGSGSSWLGTQSSTLSDYNKTFLPFAPPSHSIVAPANRFNWDADSTRLTCEKANDWLSNAAQAQRRYPLADSLELSPFELAPRGLSRKDTRAVVRTLDASRDYVDLTTSEDSKMQHESHPKEQLVMKYIYFSRDVRPPYVGTVSQVRTRRDVVRLGRKPFLRTHDDELDYDYDSEAEWEEPEEGEDLISENEDDAESEQDPADIEEFLDDKDIDEASRAKRKVLYKDMQPFSTGLCWEDARGRLSQTSFEPVIHPRQFSMELLSDVFNEPIDPFSTSYWPAAPAASSVSAERPAIASAENMRVPLQVRPALSSNNLSPSSAAKIANPAKSSTKPIRVLVGDDLEQFKRLVEGSDLTKVGLLAVLKKQLPRVSNAVLGDTLSAVAARLGAKEVDKRWKVL